LGESSLIYYAMGFTHKFVNQIWPYFSPTQVRKTDAWQVKSTHKTRARVKVRIPYWVQGSFLQHAMFLVLEKKPPMPKKWCQSWRWQPDCWGFKRLIKKRRWYLQISHSNIWH
jgi:hypothetical protein